MHSIVFLCIVGGVVLVVIGFAVLFFFVCLFEKQHIQQFEFADTNRMEPTGYTVAMNDALQKLEFHHDGTFAHKKGGVYKATVDFWISPDSMVMAVVGGGKILGVDYKKTFFYTRLESGQVLITSDDFGEADLSGIIEREVLLNAGAAELCEIHCNRLKDYDNQTKLFKRTNLLQQYEQIDADQAEKLIEMGLAVYVDHLEGVWHYSLKGAFFQVCRFRKQLQQANTQQERINIKRPGA
jgi:hypothetical protein